MQAQVRRFPRGRCQPPFPKGQPSRAWWGLSPACPRPPACAAVLPGARCSGTGTTAPPRRRCRNAHHRVGRGIRGSPAAGTTPTTGRAHPCRERWSSAPRSHRLCLRHGMWLLFLAIISKGDGISCRTAGGSPRAWPENKPSSARQELAAGEGSARAASSSGSRGNCGGCLCRSHGLPPGQHGPQHLGVPGLRSHIPGCSGNALLGLGVPGTS